MTNLIHRLEAAEGPSRELDRDIYWAAERKRAAVAFWNGSTGKPIPFEQLPDKLTAGLGRKGVEVSAPPYTASLDAAVSLVPEGMAYVLAQSRAKTQGSAQVFEEKRTAQVLALSRDPETHMEIAATPALALCIAALKAREAGNE